MFNLDERDMMAGKSFGEMLQHYMIRNNIYLENLPKNLVIGLPPMTRNPVKNLFYYSLFSKKLIILYIHSYNQKKNYNYSQIMINYFLNIKILSFISLPPFNIFLYSLMNISSSIII